MIHRLPKPRVNKHTYTQVETNSCNIYDKISPRSFLQGNIIHVIKVLTETYPNINNSVKKKAIFHSDKQIFNIISRNKTKSSTNTLASKNIPKMNQALYSKLLIVSNKNRIPNSYQQMQSSLKHHINIPVLK